MRTMLILQAANVARKDPFAEYYIYSPDTDVLVLLVHCYQMLPQVSINSTGLNYFFAHESVQLLLLH